ncbi:MAG: lysylphosphatidylglycerol synthase domain-containing protein [Gaiellaceae bacterium]
MTLLAGLGAAITVAFERVQALDGRFLAGALALQLAALAFRSFALRNVLAAAYPARRIPTASVACAYATGVALNGFLPARGGEAAKVALLRARLPGSSVPTIASSLAVVMLLDAILGASLIGVLWATGVLPELPRLPLPSVAVAPLAGVLALGVLAIGALAVRRFGALRSWLASAAAGLAVIRTPGRLFATVLPFQLAAWACRIAVVVLVLQAFRIDAGLETAALLVVLNGASTAVPVPGGAGSQQVLATYALQGAVSTAGAMSFSLGMQVGVTAVNTAVGLAAAMVLFRTLRPVAALRALGMRTR